MEPQEQEKTATSTSTSRGYSKGNWALGAAVIFIGALLLARNLGLDLGLFNFHNWWAFFILAAAFGPLQRAWAMYDKQGFNGAVWSALASASAIIILGLLFLLELSLSVWWPVFLIIGGLYMLADRDKP
jgi:hypothetical protein